MTNTVKNGCNTCLATPGIIYVNALEFFEHSTEQDPITAIEKQAEENKINKVLVRFHSHTILPTPITIIQCAMMMPDYMYVAICYPYTGLANNAISDGLKLNRTHPIRIFTRCSDAENWLHQQDFTAINKIE